MGASRTTSQAGSKPKHVEIFPTLGANALKKLWKHGEHQERLKAMGYGKKPLDFGADIVFDKENGANGKIPVFQREFKVIRPLYEPWRGLKASGITLPAALGLIGLRNDNKGVKLLDYIHIPATFEEEGNAQELQGGHRGGHYRAHWCQVLPACWFEQHHWNSRQYPRRGRVGQNEVRGLSRAAGASEDCGF